MNLFWLIPYARAVEYNLIQPLPGVQTVSSFPQYIESIIPFILSLAAILAVVMIVIGGVEYAVSLSEEGKKLARGRINNAILGLLLALVSYLILYTINPDLTKLKLDIQNLPSSSQGGGNSNNTGAGSAGNNGNFTGGGGQFGGSGASCKDWTDPNCDIILPPPK